MLLGFMNGGTLSLDGRCNIPVLVVCLSAFLSDYSSSNVIRLRKMVSSGWNRLSLWFFEVCINCCLRKASGRTEQYVSLEIRDVFCRPTMPHLCFVPAMLPHIVSGSLFRLISSRSFSANLLFFLWLSALFKDDTSESIPGH